MAYIELFEDPACTRKFGAYRFAPVEFSNNIGTPYQLTIGEKTYRAYGQIPGGGMTLLTVTSLVGADTPPFDSYKNRFPGGKWFYTKSGFRFPVTETITQGDYCGIGDMYVGTTYICAASQAMVSGETPLGLWFVQFDFNSVRYYGILGWSTVPASGSTWLQFAAEESFWTETLNPPYDYNAGSDADGGQGSGDIPDISIPRSSTPSGIVPLGGRGLKAYIIDATAYASLQGYLWGESSTVAKALWQKFQNKVHSPVSCIVGCFSLPSIFMPSSSVASGIQLAGMMLSPISGSCYSTSLSIVDVNYYFNTLVPPFGSWLDYTGIGCKLHIPFCGDITVPAEFIVDKAITISYRCDQLNGNLVCFVSADGYPIAELSGNVAYSIPVVGGDDGKLDRLGALVTGIIEIKAGKEAAGLASLASAFGVGYETQVVNCNLSGSVNACTNGVPFIEYIYPYVNYPDEYGNTLGYVASVSGSLSDFAHGYGEFEVRLDTLNIPGATDTEKREIADLLRGGIFV